MTELPPTIAPYLKEIGRGKDGARSLRREQATDLMARLLDGRLSDLEKGAFADRKSTRLNSSHSQQSRMPSSA